MNSFEITSEPIVTAELRQNLTDDTCGALVVFEGIVRNHHLGKAVESLAYEHHPIMAQPEGEKIIQEALERFPITKAFAIHRVGPCQVGELAVVTAVASSHRAEAFEACQFLIDEIKHRVPIWKFEHYADGSSVYTEQCEGCSSAKHH